MKRVYYEKIKRITISLLLVVTLVFTSISFAFANEVDASATKIYNSNGDIYQDLNNVDVEELVDDISVLETIGFDVDNIIGVITENDIEVTDETIATEEAVGDTLDTVNCNTFAYQISDDIVSEVTVIDETADGGVVLNIAEGNLNNVLYIDDNGDIYLDGNKVEYSEAVEENETGTLLPNSYTLIGWSGSAIYPTKSSDYTILQGTYTNNDIILGEKIKNVTLLVISTIITLRFKNVYVGITVAIINLMAIGVKTLADRVAPNTAHLSFKIKTYGTSKSTYSTTYTKYTGFAYVNKNCTGASTSVTFYKKATKIAK